MSDVFGHDARGNPVEAVKYDPDRPLESELEWAEANIAAGLGGQEMRDRKKRLQEALTPKEND